MDRDLTEEPSDVAAVEATLRGLFVAAGCGDLTGVRDRLTDDLLLYKIGRVKGLVDLVGAVSDFCARQGRARYELSDLVTRVGGDHASITYRSHAIIELPGEGQREARWLETALLVRSDHWRIAFFHSSDEAFA